MISPLSPLTSLFLGRRRALETVNSLAAAEVPPALSRRARAAGAVPAIADAAQPAAAASATLSAAAEPATEPAPTLTPSVAATAVAATI